MADIPVPESGYEYLDLGTELNTYLNIQADVRDLLENTDLKMSVVIIEDLEASFPMKCAILGEYDTTIHIEATIEEYAVAELPIRCRIAPEDKGIAYTFIT